MTDVYFAGGAVICGSIVLVAFIISLLVNYIKSNKPIKVMKGEIVHIGQGKEFYNIMLEERMIDYEEETCSVVIKTTDGKKRNLKMANNYSQALAEADSKSKTHEAEFHVRGKRLVKVIIDGNTIGA